MARVHPHLRAPVVLITALSFLSACNKNGDKHAPPPPPKVEIGTTDFKLVEDRVVRQVTDYSQLDAHGKPKTRDFTNGDIDDLLNHVCLPMVNEPGASLLCKGHLALQLARSVRDEYVQRPTSSSFEWYLSSSPTGVDPGSLPLYKFPVPTASDSATWALFATDFFKLIAATLSITGIRNGTRAQFDADYDYDDTGDSYGVVLMGRLAEAIAGMDEAQRIAQDYVLAAAAKKRGATASQAESDIVSAWRDRHDSRLEAASILGLISERKYEPPKQATNPPPEATRFPVAIATPATRGEKRAMELIRSTRVNPCLAGSGAWCQGLTSPTRSRTDLASDLAAALFGPARAGESAVLLAKREISLAELERAARRIVSTARVRARHLQSNPCARHQPRR
jgi:hypothetical protein